MKKYGFMKMLCCFLLLGFAGCERTEKAADPNPHTLRILSWNVQTLFDGQETGDEYDEYRSSAGWNEEKYQARLNSFARIFEGIPEKTPDLLGLMEVENPRILEDLVQGPWANQGYDWTFFGKAPQAALGIGILSRFPLEQTRTHSITSGGETIPRPILEVRIQVGEKPLVFLVCHWKSKISGDETTEPLRKAAARVVLRRLQELQLEDPQIPVIILGDLNENHDEFYRKQGLTLSALLPDDPQAAESTAAAGSWDALILSHKIPPTPEYFSPETLVLYSPWEQGGSYYYRESWETIDHFLLSSALFDQTGWDFDSFKVINQEPFINSKGFPAAYNPRTGNGLSDHLPLLLILKE